MCKKEMTAVEFLKEWKRLCKQHLFDCRGCGIAYKKGLDTGCKIWVTAHPEDAVEIVQKWAEENPVKTILDDFLEKFPHATLAYGSPAICPQHLGYLVSEDLCCGHKCYTECWKTPLEG